MLSFLKKRWKHTIARDLSVGLIVSMAAVFLCVGSANYFFSIHRDTQALDEKADEIANHLATILATPMWNLNTREIEKIVDVYRKSDIVLGIQVLDESGRPIADTATEDQKRNAYSRLDRNIFHDEKKVIGELSIFFSNETILAKQREIAVYSTIVFLFSILTVVITTTILLRRYLSEPFSRLTAGLETISSGDYSHRLPPFQQADVNSVTQKVNEMAGEIARRQHALEENRNKLEVLNQAILDIFSCSDLNNLVATTLSLCHKVCGVDRGYFLPAFNAASEDESPNTPPPMMAIEGQTFEASAEDVQPYIGGNNQQRFFTFSLSSRHARIGDITLEFDTTPEATEASLLKSLMSLANVAMIRQAFIRESAFISAELKVAETVQRSMLLDEAKTPSHAALSYHYEPVLRVGGDWFHVMESGDGSRMYILLGDVTGHGLAQGLVTTAVAGAIHVMESLIEENDQPDFAQPSRILTQLNNVISRIAGKSNLRMTCVAACLDFNDMSLRICNAGHTFPLMVRQSPGQTPTVRPLARKQQPMLGEDSPMALRHTYLDALYEFDEHDMFVFFTDGLTEATDSTGRPFGRKFHRQFHDLSQTLTPGELKNTLIRRFRSHTSGSSVQDDVCLLIAGKRSITRDRSIA